MQLPEGNVNAQVNFVLAAQGFSIGVSTVRPVYVTGESLEATVNVRDAKNKPLAQKLKLKVLERTLVNGRPGERLVEEHELATAADGKARQTIKLDKGGTYFLRGEAIDRFHNPITGQAAVQISGEDDLVRLRILADQHTYKVGDRAAVQLHWRDEPALALVTYQGARVLDYRLVELKTGVNKLEIPMTASLAPNFELAVAVMTDPRPEVGRKDAEKDEKRAKPQAVKRDEKQRPIVRFHSSTSPFTVEARSAREDRNQIEVQRTGPSRRRTGSDGHHDRSAGQAGAGRVEPGDDRAIAAGAVRLAAADDRRFLPRRRARRPSAARRASRFPIGPPPSRSTRACWRKRIGRRSPKRKRKAEGRPNWLLGIAFLPPTGI